MIRPTRFRSTGQYGSRCNAEPSLRTTHGRRLGSEFMPPRTLCCSPIFAARSKEIKLGNGIDMGKMTEMMKQMGMEGEAADEETMR
jgi:hypothetical protein